MNKKLLLILLGLSVFVGLYIFSLKKDFKKALMEAYMETECIIIHGVCKCEPQV